MTDLINITQERSIKQTAIDQGERQDEIKMDAIQIIRHVIEGYFEDCISTDFEYQKEIEEAFKTLIKGAI